jgi:hypothetical protein
MDKQLDWRVIVATFAAVIVSFCLIGVALGG